MVEAKVLEKIRSILIADTAIKSYVNDRVYTEHISSVTDPVYPAISLHLMPGQARVEVPEMVNASIQIDLWFPVDKYTADEVFAVYGLIRALLHRQNLTDTTIGIKVQQIIESETSPILFDEASNCRHLGVRYRVVVI